MDDCSASRGTDRDSQQAADSNVADQLGDNGERLGGLTDCCPSECC